MRLIKSLSILALCSVVLFGSENEELLSSLKRDMINLDKKKNELESDNLKYSWINDIVLSFTMNRSDGSGRWEDTNTLSVSANQPIFKSGGIYYSIKYAKANRELLRVITKQATQSEIKSVLSALYGLKKLNLQIKRQKLQLKNANIDIIRKKEQYESGFLDSSYLDQAILSKSSIERSLLDMYSTRLNYLKTLKSFSDKDYSEVTLPEFKLININEYLKNSLILRQKQKEIQTSKYLKKMTVANYLPTISLTASHTRSYDYGDRISSSYGLRFSIPLISVNRSRTIEMKKLEYLKSKLALQDTKRAEKEEFLSILQRVKLIEKKIELSKRDLKLYDSLLSSTKESYEAGEKTKYDVDTLENSKKSVALDVKIFEIDKQLLLLDLYAKMNGKI